MTKAGHEDETIGSLAIQGGTANQAIQKLGPLRAVLAAISADYANREVRRRTPSQASHLLNMFAG